MKNEWNGKQSAMPHRSTKLRRVLTVLALILPLALVGCDDDTAVEEAEDAVEEAGESLEDAADEAVDEAEDAAEDVEDEIEGAG